MDLSKIKNREKYIIDCETNLINELREINLSISPNAVASIRDSTIEIGVNYQNRQGYKFDFASEVKVYIEDKSMFASGSSGSFDPLDESNLSSYWRTVHGGEILKNWRYVEPIFKKYFSMVNKLYDILVSN